ncbi:MAG: energy transducer TonB [Thermodesulfobacteriaceae bacterium]|nr:energy transducer TonB [Thermodesulfobacteriaceae bacterium]MCX8041164.1 energy transducer TonB [Thermodesulfobacteriaceae bacterium]MDW8135786.1 energy transducer TonB [Thermodesulfobacterium sp.]
MSEKVKAYSLSILIHLLFILPFSYFLSSSMGIPNQKYLEIDLSLYNLREEGGGRKELPEVKKTFSKTLSSQKVLSPERVYYPENVPKVKTEENKIEDAMVKNEDINKRGIEEGLAKGMGVREGEVGSRRGEKGEGVGKGGGTGTEMKPEELYLHSKLGIISKIVQNHISYPYLARKMGWEGKVIISFLLTKEGKVTNFTIEKTSSYEILDQNALETVKRCAKLFPLPPVDVKIKLPIVYQLN